MTQHRFLNDGRSPIPMGSTAEYVCVCGRRGTHAVIERHIAENAAGDESASESTPTAPYPQLVEDFGGGDTMAHYLPNEPRRPATPEPLPPIPVVDDEEHPRSIAELFQDMLRAAYQAGAVSASSGETFETWYQREVLQ